MIKRAFDLALSAVGLVALAPLFLLVALVIRLDSPGPALYCQWRVGRDFLPFRIWKFRTMVCGADTAGGSLTLRADRRITRAGAFLRRCKIDELPQLWNVFRGDMSLVGPRPEVQRFVDHFPREYTRLLRVRPGITDLASLRFRRESELLAQSHDADRLYLEQILPEKLRLSQLYLQHASFGYDLLLIVRTLWAAIAPAARPAP